MIAPKFLKSSYYFRILESAAREFELKLIYKKVHTAEFSLVGDAPKRKRVRAVPGHKNR